MYFPSAEQLLGLSLIPVPVVSAVSISAIHRNGVVFPHRGFGRVMQSFFRLETQLWKYEEGSGCDQPWRSSAGRDNIYASLRSAWRAATDRERLAIGREAMTARGVRGFANFDWRGRATFGRNPPELYRLD